jgi:hypothetical protein
VVGGALRAHNGVMSSAQVPVELVPPSGATRRPRTWLPLVVVAACAAALGVFLVLPYYANGLDRYPLDEVAAGFHDPKELWPYASPMGGLFWFGAFFAMTLGPFVVFCTMLWSASTLIVDRGSHTRHDRRVLGLAVVVAVGTLAWFLTPFASALMSWFLD